MSKVVVDARGCGCPEPVLKTKKAAAKSTVLQVLVDNNTAKENVSRFAKSQGFTCTVQETEDGYKLDLTK